jgi:hypothetical protein
MLASRSLRVSLVAEIGFITELHAGSDSSALYYYEFDVTNDGSANIDKFAGSNYKNLAHSSNVPMYANGPNQLRAMCTNASGQNAVRLVFWVNGEKLLDTTDRTKPIPGGTVGLRASTLAKTAGKVQFDNFVVTQN